MTWWKRDARDRIGWQPRDEQPAGGEDRVIRLWDVSAGQEVRSLPGLVNAPLTVSFSRDGRRLFSAAGQNEGEERFLRVWSVDSGRILTERGGTGSVWCAAFDVEGGIAFTAGTDKRIQRWIVE